MQIMINLGRMSLVPSYPSGLDLAEKFSFQIKYCILKSTPEDFDLCSIQHCNEMRCIWLDLYKMNYSNHRIILLLNVENRRIFYNREFEKFSSLCTDCIISCSLLTEQSPPGKVGHEEVDHVDYADYDTHCSHSQTCINVPETAKCFRIINT